MRHSTGALIFLLFSFVTTILAWLCNTPHSSDVVAPTHAMTLPWHFNMHLWELGSGCSRARQRGDKAPCCEQGFQCLLQMLGHWCHVLSCSQDPPSGVTAVTFVLQGFWESWYDILRVFKHNWVWSKYLHLQVHYKHFKRYNSLCFSLFPPELHFTLFPEQNFHSFIFPRMGYPQFVHISWLPFTFTLLSF